MPWRARPLSERFWAKVDKRGPMLSLQLGPCWMWLASQRGDGYGQIVAENGRLDYAHRVAYRLFVAPIPDGLELDHLCRNHACVNPAHLEPVTGRENKRRGTSPAALNAQKTHCIRGHEFSPANTITERRGRKCRTCHNERRRQRHA